MFMDLSKKKRARAVLDALSEVISRPETELRYSSEYELIVAVILSAQCTDERVNMITPSLFKIWPTFESLSTASAEEVAQIIASISYPNNKSKHLVAMASKVIGEYDGKLPKDQASLMKLSGVGRKTAQVVSSVAFGDQDALPVDTHVFRVANRIGLVENADTPLKVEMGLKNVILRQEWGRSHHLLILHGRYTCRARNPDCQQCAISDLCKYFEKLKQLPKQMSDLNPSYGKYYCATRKVYFDKPTTRIDRHGTQQIACPKCNSMNVFHSKTGVTTKIVRDFRIA